MLCFSSAIKATILYDLAIFSKIRKQDLFIYFFLTGIIDNELILRHKIGNI